MKLFKFIIKPKEKELIDFFTQTNNLPEFLFTGYYLVAIITNKKEHLYGGNYLEMHLIKSRKAKIFNKAIAFAKYPVKKENIIFLNN